MQARSAMTRDVIFLGPTDTLCEAWLTMSTWHIRHLPVVASGRLVGILSDRDVLRHAVLRGGELDVPKLRVSEVMVREPMTCVASSTISHVAGLMVDNHLDAIPVVEGEGRLVGLVTSSDLIQLLRDHDQKEGKVIPFTFNLRQQEHAVA